LWWTVRLFCERADVCQLILTVSEQNKDQVDALLTDMAISVPWVSVLGGAERQDSVARALMHLLPEAGFVAVHDGARPLTAPGIVDAAFQGAFEYGAAVTAVPAKDTIKVADANGFVDHTPERATLWQVQTPQVARRSLLTAAYEKAAQEGFRATDDAALLEWLGVKVKMTSGDYRNIKITTPEDMQIAQVWLSGGSVMKHPRIGMGYDVHRLVEGRPLVMGGVEVPHERGLDGHSDADVLLHAISDALLGAAALGDIGRHFPDSDPAYKGASSLKLLGAVRQLVADAGYAVGNVDAVIVAEKPKFAPHIGAMRRCIADVLGIGESFVGVKATTTEGLGFAGRKEGIAAYSTVTIVPV
jgi:2-C-methyl-D-erythritol 4-phosphate cytidylyltransferase/2-C-methyl-D-erythritol 2,4-cyclodiphosphate synthase